MNTCIATIRIGDTYQIVQELAHYISVYGCFLWGGCCSLRWNTRSQGYVVSYTFTNDMGEHEEKKQTFSHIYEAVIVYLSRVGGDVTINVELDPAFRKEMGFPQPDMWDYGIPDKLEYKIQKVYDVGASK